MTDYRLSKFYNNKIFSEEIIEAAGLLKKSSLENPKAIILAGQPGAGKGRLAEVAELELNQDVVKIDPDELREFHPQVEALRNAHPYTWSGYTHPDASRWADELLQATIDGRKNLIFDTTLSNGQWSSDLIKDLQARGYDVEVRVMAAHKLESEHGVDARFAQQLDREGHGRYVPAGAREAIYTKLPISLDTVHAQTSAPIRIFNRQGAELYDSRTDARAPAQALEQARNAWFKDPAVTQQLREKWQQQADWHRDLPAHAQDIPNSDPAISAKLLAEHAELNVSDGVASRLEGIATIDELVRPGAPPARIPVPEPEIPGLHRAGMTAGLAGLGVAASAYDAVQTGERVSTLLSQDNLTAARSEALHFGARGAGGWAGGTAAAAVVGTTGAGPVALVLADGYLFSAAADKAATRWDNRRIYTQTDNEGVSWEFNGTQWLRQQKTDLQNDGVDTSQKQAMFALPEKARELNYHASRTATEQALGKVQPSNPYVQRSSETDTSHLYQRDWRHDPANGQWSRMVADEVDQNDRPIWTVDPASPERNAALDRQAAQVVEANIARGPAVIAATYQAAHQRNGWDDIGPMPAAVQTALNPDSLQASNGAHYQRDAQGRWHHQGEVAQGNVALELETTRARLQPALEQHAQAMAQMPARQRPTLQQQDQANTQATYIAYGVAPNATTVAAIQLAVQRTRDAHGIDAATTSLALQRDALGHYSVDSPIQHLRRDADAVVRVAATTSSEDIRQAMSEVQARHQAQAATTLPTMTVQPQQPPQPHQTAAMQAAPSPRASAQSGQQQDMHAQALEQQRQWQLQQDQQLQLQQHQQQHQQQQKQEQQREHERRAEDEKTRDAQRDKEQPATAAAAQGERTQPLPGLLPYSDPAHPRHALYADVQERMQAQGHRFSEERLTQITAALNESYFKPGWKGEFYVARNTVYASNNDHPLGCACVPMHAPAPSIQASMQVAQEGDLQHAQIAQRIAQDRLQSQSQPGMTL